jgi:site-specific DNA-methyltransferase (cytosine-N4-specific)
LIFLQANSVDCVFTSPNPFRYLQGKVTYDNGDQYIGDQQDEYPGQYINKLAEVFQSVHRVLRETGSLWVHVEDSYNNISGELENIPGRFIVKMNVLGFHLQNHIIWDRRGSGVKQRNKFRFLMDYDHILHFSKQPSAYYFNENSKYIGSSVMSIPYDGPELMYHTDLYNSGYPGELIEMVIDSTCPENGKVLDPFMGSGVTGLVALAMSRWFVGIDIDEVVTEYVNSKLNENTKQWINWRQSNG